MAHEIDSTTGKAAVMVAGGRREITVREAVGRLADGLRRFAASDQARHLIGSASSSVRTRDAQAAQRQRQAASLADRLDAAADEAALDLLRAHDNTLANMDPLGYYLGSWRHVAQMVGHGERYVLDGGVLCHATRPYGPSGCWDAEACEWREAE